MVPTPHKRSSDQRARFMQLDNYTETAESNFAAVLAAREKCSRMRSLADQHWPQSFARIRILGLKPSRASPMMLWVLVEHTSHCRPYSCSVICLHRVCEAGPYELSCSFSLAQADDTIPTCYGQLGRRRSRWLALGARTRAQNPCHTAVTAGWKELITVTHTPRLK